METPSNGSAFLERLRARLLPQEQQYQEEEQRPRWIAISICLLISLLLWFTLTMQETYTAMIELPTRVVNLPEDLALVSLPPSTVRAQVRGAGFDLLRLRYNPTAVPIDATEDRVDLDVLAPELPNGVILEGVNPRVFNLQKDRRVIRHVPVELRGSITTPDTYDLLQRPTLTPDSVFVMGAHSIVDGLESWPTAPLEVNNLTDSLAVMVSLSDSLAGLVELSDRVVQVQAQASLFTEANREIEVLVTGVPSSQRVVALDPEVVRVRYRVPLSQYEASLTAPDFFATVSYEVIRADTTGRVRPELTLPTELTLRDVDMIPPLLGYYEVLVQE